MLWAISGDVPYLLTWWALRIDPIEGHGPVFFSTTDPGTGVTLPPEWLTGHSEG